MASKYSDVFKDKYGGRQTASTYLKTYVDVELNGGWRDRARLLQAAGISIPDSVKGASGLEPYYAILDANPEASQKLYDSIGLSSSADRQEFLTGTTTPASGTTPASRAKEAKNTSKSTSGYTKTNGILYGPDGKIVTDAVTIGKYYNATPEGTGAGGSVLDKPVTGAAYLGDDAYNGLSQDEKDFVDMAYNAIADGGEEEAKLLADAIEQAQAVADPYFKSILELTKAEIASSIAKANNDYETAAKIAQTTRDRLLEDVTANKDYLTLEQQAYLAKEARGYESDLLDIADTAAEKGLTFATGVKSRAGAETLRTTEYQDVVQSSGREFNYKMRALEAQAARGDEDAATELEKLKKQQSFKLSDIGRSAEEALGTKNLPEIEGYTPTGGVTGSIEEQKRKSILSDTGAFVDLSKGFNFS